MVPLLLLSWLLKLPNFVFVIFLGGRGRLYVHRLVLKELRHEDFTISSQFCAKSLLSAFTHTKNAPVKL